MAELNQLKEESSLDAILIADNKGFEIHNSGFVHPHHLHSLKQLSAYFFPGLDNTVVGIETTDYTVIVREVEDKMVATRELKQQ